MPDHHRHRDRESRAPSTSHRSGPGRGHAPTSAPSQSGSLHRAFRIPRAEVYTNTSNQASLTRASFSVGSNSRGNTPSTASDGRGSVRSTPAPPSVQPSPAPSGSSGSTASNSTATARPSPRRELDSIWTELNDGISPHSLGMKTLHTTMLGIQTSPHPTPANRSTAQMHLETSTKSLQAIEERLKKVLMECEFKDDLGYYKRLRAKVALDQGTLDDVREGISSGGKECQRVDDWMAAYKRDREASQRAAVEEEWLRVQAASNRSGRR